MELFLVCLFLVLFVGVIALGLLGIAISLLVLLGLLESIGAWCRLRAGVVV